MAEKGTSILSARIELECPNPKVWDDTKVVPFSKDWLLPEDFLNFADFPLNFSARAVGGAFIFHTWVAESASSFLFDLSLGLFGSPLCSIFGARFHRTGISRVGNRGDLLM
jgi:hypothetical protein